MFPTDRFLRIGATQAECAALQAFWGANTTRFDGLSEGDLRQALEDYRSSVTQTTDLPVDSDVPDPGSDVEITTSSAKPRPVPVEK